MGNWAYRVSVDGLQELLGKLQAYPKHINAALKRAGRKSNTLVLQVMRTKVPKKGRKKKLKRNATITESVQALTKGLAKSIRSKLKFKKRKQPKPGSKPRRRKSTVYLLGNAIKGVYRSAIKSAGKFLRGERSRKKQKQYFDFVMEAGRTGMLRKSLGGKVAINRKTGAVYAMAGPRRRRDGFQAKAWSPWTKKMIDVIPSKYAHLVERGHVVKINGKVVGRAKARPFTRPSYDEVKGKVEALTAQVLQEELDKLMSKSKAAPVGGEP